MKKLKLPDQPPDGDFTQYKRQRRRCQLAGDSPLGYSECREVTRAEHSRHTTCHRQSPVTGRRNSGVTGRPQDFATEPSNLREGRETEGPRDRGTELPGCRATEVAPRIHSHLPKLDKFVRQICSQIWRICRHNETGTAGSAAMRQCGSADLYSTVGLELLQSDISPNFLPPPPLAGQVGSVYRLLAESNGQNCGQCGHHSGRARRMFGWVMVGLTLWSVSGLPD